MRRALMSALLVAVLTGLGGAAHALESPWISDTYFYWYQWDYGKRLGSWIGGVYNTPLVGYYDSARLDDNTTQLHLASEWGITHHFMDFWGHGWLDEKGRPREQCVLDAAQTLRERGYDCWMSFYQDGEDFQMDDFARNLDPERDVEGLVRLYGKHPAVPRLDGKPLQLVYGRNGVPQPTATDEGFRDWLRRKYPTLADLRRWWKQDVADWEAIRWNPGGTGVARADAILYQYALWQQSWAEVNQIVREKHDLPGLVASFDIAFQPFRGWGYSLQAKTFCGPHSYGGIFDQPQTQDPERFIQAAVAKWYGTVFFDTFKNFYHDWEIRIPGTCYPPEPRHFDRFWTVALAHYAEALLHLSWNEWWEGSNLEPCWEYGKTYCEKNLLYATVMKACFDSIRQAQTRGEVAVLLNDWHWLVSGQQAADIQDTVQALRAQSVDFKLLPDDFVTAENLRDVRLVVAPTGGTGLGFNEQGEALGAVLSRWLAEDGGRRLVLGKLPGDDAPAQCGADLRQALGLRGSAPTPPGAVSESVNAFVDVGEEKDDNFIRVGCAQREDWGKLPEEAFGARDRRHTVRWCPGTGSETVFTLPVAPGKDHVLALAGDALWPNEVTVYLDGKPAGKFAIEAGYREYEVRVPAAATPQAGITALRLEFARANVPKELAPERFPTESRVCNLAIDWVHLRTADQPADVRTPAQLPEVEARFRGPLAGVRAAELSLTWEQVTAEGATVLSEYPALGVNRDLVLADGRVWYCNGMLGEVKDRAYWRAVLDWAGVKPQWLVQGPDLVGARLQAGTTTVLAAYNTDITRRTQNWLAVPRHEWPVAEVQAITEDGAAFRPLRLAATEPRVSATVSPQYCALYQFTFCPVRPDVPRLELAANTERSFEIGLRNLTGEAVAGRLTLRSYLPTLTAPWAEFSVAARGQTKVALPVTARQDLDWGAKTVILVIEVGGKEALFWRPLTVLAEPEWKARATHWSGDQLLATITSRQGKWAQMAEPEGVEAWVGGQCVGRGDLQAKPRGLAFSVPAALVGDSRTCFVELRYQVFGRERRTRLEMAVPERVADAVEAPQGAVMAFAVDHSPGEAPQAVSLSAPSGVPEGDLAGPLVVADAEGRQAPAAFEPPGPPGAPPESQLVSGGSGTVWAVLPSEGPGPFFVCKGEGEPATDLSCEVLDGGKVRVVSSEITAVFDPAKGGTMTELRWRGGRNLAQNSFGASWGVWGKYNPLKPAINAQAFLSQERKRYQSDAAAQVRVLRATPADVEIEVTQTRPGIELRQLFHFWAYVPYFHAMSSARLTEGFDGEEVAVLDVPLERGDWNKIFPNFTGVFEGEEAISGGWREAPYVPPCATIMRNPTFRGSLSLAIVSATPPVTWWRQGFYPRRRGQIGVVDTARLELVAKQVAPGAQLSAGGLVLLHDGYQAVAEDTRERMTGAGWHTLEISGRRGARPVPREDWWSQAWEARVAVEGKPGPEGLRVTVPLRHEGKWLQPESLRAVWQGPRGPRVLAALARPVIPADAQVLVDPPEAELGEGRLYVYARLGEKAPLLETDVTAGLPNPSFEKGGEGWALAGAVIDDTVAHTGKRSVRLHAKASGGHALLSNAQVAVEPREQYRLKLWARTETPGAALKINFYAGAEYDFQQMTQEVEADGRWHQYEVSVPTGDFPAAVYPALRVWVYHHAGPVWVDDLQLEVKAPPPADARAVRVETLGD